MGRQRKPLDVAEIVAAYEAGEVPASIAKRHGVAAQTIRNRLHEKHVQMREGGPRPAGQLPIDRIAAEYERGEELPALAARYGVHPETLRCQMIRHGGQLRAGDAGLRLRLGKHGDMAALCAELGRTEQQMTELLLKHGFVY